MQHPRARRATKPWRLPEGALLRRAWCRCFVATLSILALLAWSSPTGAAQDPTLDFWTIETKHFRIHYEKRLEPPATVRRGVENRKIIFLDH